MLSKRKESKSLKDNILNTLILLTIFLSIILIVYLVFDSSIDVEYMTLDSESKPNKNYKRGFTELISNIDSGLMTGIPTYDDYGVMYGDTIEITKGKGDFVNIQNSMNVSNKTFTYYNNEPWTVSTDQFIFGFSSKLHESSTLYETTGIVKLFDRYVWTAVGTYWADAFNLERHTGNTYRVNLDTGISYDIISFDVKSPNHTINTPVGGLSLGQPNKDKTNICLTEFDIIDYRKNYPVRDKDEKRPSMNYQSMLKYKRDIDHTSIALKMGSFDYIPEFKGNIISVQLIEDPAVKEIFSQAREEVEKYR